ncbi:hypothetical protein CLCR_05257 [Cladophialophora carrionii]|uniref:Uncharacterized protein n=1 Tax=Cladophialophora carrionii TaxID=86049 RepID=A0A1C1CKL5_9EURO|nr:hypothetical protein CLCR_05257 [Cladophialophora carrionii]
MAARKFEGALLVLGVPVSQLSSAVHDTCNMLEQGGWRESLEFVLHTGIWTVFLSFKRDRPSGSPGVKDRLSDNVVLGPGCVQSVVKGFSTDVTVETATAKFPGGMGESPQDSWQLSL